MPKVVLDKERTLKIAYASLVLLEQRYGSVEAVFAKLRQGSLTAFRDLLWAALLHEDPGLTPENVGAMISIRDISALAEAVNEALEEAVKEMARPEAGAGSLRGERWWH